jgi:hypothetical protein
MTSAILPSTAARYVRPKGDSLGSIWPFARLAELPPLRSKDTLAPYGASRLLDSRMLLGILS